MHGTKKNGWQRLWKALLYSCSGLKAAWRHEASFRQEIVIILMMVPAAFWLGESAAQRGLLIFSLLAILISELFNSAIEAVVDRIGSEAHPLSGQAKDLGSAAVLISLTAAAVVWGIAAWERWWA
jgi:diacylglycerol kinase (ATP)